jgi:cold shock CspA family protein
VGRICSCTSVRFQADGYKSLPEGAKVDYEPQEGQKAPQAANVTVVP